MMKMYINTYTVHMSAVYDDYCSIHKRFKIDIIKLLYIM